MPGRPEPMDSQERREIREAAREVAAWVAQARRVEQWHAGTREDLRRQLAALDARGATVFRGGEPTWRVVALSEEDGESLVSAFVDRANLPRPDAGETAVLTQLGDRTAAALRATRVLSPVRWLLASRSRREQVVPQARFLRDLHHQGRQSGVTAVLARMSRSTLELDPEALALDDLVDPRLGLAGATGAAAPPGLLDATSFGELPRAMADIGAALDEERAARESVATAVGRHRAPAVRAALAALPLETLKEAAPGALRLGPLAAAGIATVQDVLDRRRELRQLPGIGAGSYRRLMDAAHTLERLTAEEQPVRLALPLDPASRTVVAALAAWDGVRRTRGAGPDLALARSLEPLVALVDDRVARLLVVPVRGVPTSRLADAIATVVRRADVVAATEGRGVPGDAAADFEARPADYHAMLGELGYLVEDEETAHGDLPPGLVDAVREQSLRTEALTVALRGYQSFGARFALVQRKVVIGDEMGLGKTIEALAVLAHLWATGATHFLVVCPPGVLVNWLREITTRSTLEPHRIHGPEWQGAAAAWLVGGGIAVTTYDTTWMASRAWARGPRIACVVVDEAQYVKNPEALRSRRTAALLATVDRAILLTGTPMQNHVAEFRTLISYLQPGLVTGGEELAPRLFRRAVAPAYLRRNQEDVLAELPGLVEVEEWLPLGARDLIAYQAAVVEGNLMRMRRAAMLHGPDSPKVERLVEIVEEAEDNGRRVIVYSYFNDVLAAVRQVLPGRVFGPLDGSVAAGARQRLVDEFSAADGGAALLAQITTGGVGLNIQAASVVVLCEPQLNPAVEAQAIARAHRMGQLHRVQVHRLLSVDAVDERIHELLEHKRQLFEEYAGTSVTAEATPEATDAEIARQVLAAERERLLYEPPVVPAPDDV